MIVVLKQNPNQAQLESLIAWLEEKQISVNKSVGTSVSWAIPPRSTPT